jgi:hypothetical protein
MLTRRRSRRAEMLTSAGWGRPEAFPNPPSVTADDAFSPGVDGGLGTVSQV